MSIPVSVRTRTRLIGLCLVPFLLAACGDPVKEAEFEAARGELEQAERTLGDAGGRRAEALRRRIADLREERAAVEEGIQRYVALAADGDMQAAKSGLRRLGEGIQDARSRAAVDQARSALSDLAAAEVTRRASSGPVAPRGSTRLPGESETNLRAREVELVNSMITRIIDNVKASAAEKDWLRARSMISMAIASSGEHASELQALQDSVEAQARAEMESLFESAKRIESESGAEASFNFLAAESDRFPTSGRLAVYHDRMQALGTQFTASIERGNRASTPVAVAEPPRNTQPKEPAEPRAPREPGESAESGDAGRSAKPDRQPSPLQPESTPTPGADEDATARLILATQLEEEDKLAEARDEWNRAAQAFPRGGQRARAEQHAKNLEARLVLRREVAGALESRPDFFALLGIESIDDEFFVQGGKSIRWKAVEDSLFERALLLTTLSDQGQVGWIQELLVRGKPGALDELAAALARKTVSEEQAWSILAGARSEIVPADGYAYVDGKWVDRGASRREELATELAALRKKLTSAGVGKRDEQFAALFERGDEARESLQMALEKRWTTALATIERSPSLEQLTRVAKQRESLDARRAEALALIFDEVEYFYPYNPPECPPDKARLYPEVQRRVDELVARVREVWDEPKRASIAKKFSAAVEELSWNRQRQAELKLAFELSEDLPTWLSALDPEADELTLHSFAWTAAELEARKYDQTVLGFNEASWAKYKAAKGDEGSEADNGEQTQVRITNAYRMMLGRRALAWNSRLQAASQGHSDWMSETGKFTHFNDTDPARTTPADRMRLAGYNSGISENLHQGGSGPEGAHNGWSQSSGHHRNLLMSGHSEMGSATAGPFWTQNFGVGVGFRKEL